MSTCYIKESKYKFFKSILLVILSFSIISILSGNSFEWAININQYLTGYVCCIFCWIVFWKKLGDLFINEEKINRKNAIILTILSIFSITANEEINIITIFLLLIILINNIYINIKTKQKKNLFYIIIPIITCLIINFLLKKYGAYSVVDDYYKLEINFFQPFQIYREYIYLFIKRIIFENTYILIPIIISLMILFRYKNINIKNKNAIKFILFTILSIFLYTLSTIYMTHNAYGTRENDYTFWFLHCGLITILELILLSVCIYSVSLALNENNFKNGLNLILLTLFCLIIGIKIYPPILDLYFSDKNTKKVQYMTDKIATSYLRKNRTAIIPTSTHIGIINTHTPENIRADVEIYSKIYTKENAPYLIYLEHEYNVNTEKGITFKPDDEAMHLYFEQGGFFTDEELEKLDFQKIKNNSI